MDYKLALELRMAGYPIVADLPPDYKGDTFISPTLSELIEACGEGFEVLSKDEDRWYANNYYTKEQEEKQDDSIFKLITGSTPEEAVARLFISLQEKG